MFLQKKPLDHVLSIYNNHICRSPPKEAAIFSVVAEGESITRFRGTFKADLSVNLVHTHDEATGGALPEEVIYQQQRQQQTTQAPQETEGATVQPVQTEHSSLTVPLNFSKDSLSVVSQLLCHISDQGGGFTSSLSRLFSSQPSQEVIFVSTFDSCPNIFHTMKNSLFSKHCPSNTGPLMC